MTQCKFRGHDYVSGTTEAIQKRTVVKFCARGGHIKMLVVVRLSEMSEDPGAVDRRRAAYGAEDGEGTARDRELPSPINMHTKFEVSGVVWVVRGHPSRLLAT